MATDYASAQEHFVPRSFMFNSNHPVAVVIHKTGGDATPQAVYNTFLASGNPGKSAHYAIGQDGSIWQFVPENLGAGANGVTDGTTETFWKPYIQQYGNLNTCTISIEHCDPSSQNDTPLTPAQKQASFMLVTHLCQKYGIAADHIKPHKSIVSTACPGTYPMDELRAFVAQGGSTMGVPGGWKDNGETLTAPNGVTVGLGFRAYILGDYWDPEDVPLRPEYHADSVLIHNAGVGPGQRLDCKKSLLWYTERTGVVKEAYPVWELDAAYQQNAALQKENADLKAQLAQSTPAPMPNVTEAAANLEAASAAINTAATLVSKAVANLKQ